MAALARRRLAFAWTVASPPPRGAPCRDRPRPDPFQPPRDPAGSYDYEGTAREVTDPRPSPRASAVSEAVAIELTDPAGEPLRIDWTSEALAALSTPAPPARPWSGGSAASSTGTRSKL